MAAVQSTFAPPVFATLLGTLREFYRKMGFEKLKFKPGFFPYTEPSAEVYAYVESRKIWMELGGSGVFRPEVTRPFGCDVPVLAWGLGLERLAMYLQGVDNVFDLKWTEGLSYGDVYHQNEVEQSAYNFEHSDADFLFTAFGAHEKQAQHLMNEKLALPAYEQVLKAAHTFNLLDARGAISVTERAAYIGRIRNLARSVAQSYLDSRARLGFPMAPKAHAEEVLAQLNAKKAA